MKVFAFSFKWCSLAYILISNSLLLFLREVFLFPISFQLPEIWYCSCGTNKRRKQACLFLNEKFSFTITNIQKIYNPRHYRTRDFNL